MELLRIASGAGSCADRAHGRLHTDVVSSGQGVLKNAVNERGVINGSLANPKKGNNLEYA